MISAEVIKGVNELLGNSGIELRRDEPFGDYVARALGISASQSETLLETLHDGGTVEDAIAAAKISPASLNRDLLTRIAQAIGTALGRVASAS